MRTLRCEAPPRADDEWRQRYETLIDNAVDGMVLIDANGTVVEFNPAAERLFGYDAPEVVGLNVAILMPPAVAAEHDDYLARHLRTGETRIIGTGRRVDGRRKDGSTVPLHLSVSPLDLADGRRYLGVLRDLSVEVALQRALERQASRDDLTDLPNRSYLLRRLEDELTAGEPGVLFLDLDGFKTLNDSRGHVVGDLLLREVAERLRHAIGPQDLLARLGGDEFVVVRPGRPGVAELESLARRLIATVERPYTIERGTVHLSMSVGIARGCAEAGGAAPTPVEMLRDADMAMYVAKSVGRGRFQHVTDEHRRAAVERHELAENLRHALASDEMVLHYQPIVDLATGEVHAVEALLRWAHPQLGLMPPGSFLPLAYDCGLIPRLDLLVLEMAVAQAAEWSRGRTPVQVWVNNSGQVDDETVSLVADRLAGYGCAPELLGIEITETQLMIDTSRENALRGLRALGVSLAVDDFGAGYSNLARLQSLRIDVLKLDRSLVTSIPDNRTMLHIASTVRELARGLGVRTVAEGIETPAQLAAAHSLGIDFAQGFHVGRPAPVEETSSLLAGGRTLPTTR